MCEPPTTRTKVTVDDHMNHWCDCASDFQMEVNKERCAETLMTVGLMCAETAVRSRGRDTSGMCGDQTTSETNMCHGQMQLREQDDAKVIRPRILVRSIRECSTMNASTCNVRDFTRSFCLVLAANE